MTEYELSARKAIQAVEAAIALLILHTLGDSTFAELLHFLNASPRNTVARWAKRKGLSESTVFSAWRRAAGPDAVSLRDVRRLMARARIDACSWYHKLSTERIAVLAGFASSKSVRATLRALGYRNVADRAHVLTRKSTPGKETQALEALLRDARHVSLDRGRPLEAWTPRPRSRRPFDA